MQHGMNSILNPSSSPSSASPTSNPHPMQIHAHPFHDPNSDDFLDQMLSSINSSPWPDLTDNDANAVHPDAGFSGFEVPASLSSKLRQHQVNGGNQPLNKLVLQQQTPHLMMPSRGTSAVGNVLQNDPVLIDNFGSNPSDIKGNMYSNFTSGTQQHHFSSPQAQFGAVNPTTAPPPQPQGSGSSSGAAGQQAKPKVRARRGQATDPHSIAERLRRERIAERMKSLQELVPNANKTDKASMLDEIIDYVKFLQLQVKVLSMSRLGGAASVAPLVADMPTEGGVVTESNGGNNGVKENMTVTEHQVAKMMEEDMGSAMQYLQGKGLCLMPISLATAISTATCHGRNAPISIGGGSHRNGDGPPSPNMSGLSLSNPVGDVVKDSESVN